jgi:hypothetical protein
LRRNEVKLKGCRVVELKRCNEIIKYGLIFGYEVGEELMGLGDVLLYMLLLIEARVTQEKAVEGSRSQG